MQHTISQSLIADTLVAKSVPRKFLRRNTLSVSVIEMWQESLNVFMNHAVPILIWAFLAFAFSILVSSIATSVMSYAYYNNPSSSTINLSNFRNLSFMTWVIQGGIGLLLMGLGRAAISWISIQDPDHVKVSFFEASIAALRRWHVLVFGGLFVGILGTIATLGLMLLLREFRLDESNITNTRTMSDPIALFRGLYLRMLHTFIPPLDSPFREVISYVRWAIRQPQSGLPMFSFAATTPDTVSPSMWAMGIAGGVGLLLVDVIFRLRFISAVNSASMRPWAGLGESVGIAIRNFGQLFAHLYLFRVFAVLFWALFYIIPFLIVQFTIVPYLFSRINSFWVYNIANNIFSAAGSLVMMLVMLLGVIYESRLYLRFKTAA
jgi:hypothetical protein